MPASAADAIEGLLDTDIREMEPVTEIPDDRELYELVLQRDQDPKVVRRYRGVDAVPREVVFISGDVGEPAETLDASVHPDREYTRLVCTDRTDAKNALEGMLEMGTFERVDGGEAHVE